MGMSTTLMHSYERNGLGIYLRLEGVAKGIICKFVPEKINPSMPMLKLWLEEQLQFQDLMTKIAPKKVVKLPNFSKVLWMLAMITKLTINVCLTLVHQYTNNPTKLVYQWPFLTP